MSIHGLQLSAKDLERDAALGSAGARAAQGHAPGQEPEWLSRLIERELLVQEAQRRGLDRDPEFMVSIERFWKEALMKQLLRRKAREISGQVQVYEPEIEEYYRRWKEEKPSAPALESAREEIARLVRRQKEGEAMEKWVADLRARAKIVIDPQVLEQPR